MLGALKAKGQQLSLSRWRDWVRKADAGVAGHKLKSWVAPGDSDYLVAVELEDGSTVIRPAEVAEAFAEEWGELWKPQDGRDLDDLCRAMAAGEAELPPHHGGGHHPGPRGYAGQEGHGAGRLDIGGAQAPLPRGQEVACHDP